MDIKLAVVVGALLVASCDPPPKRAPLTAEQWEWVRECVKHLGFGVLYPVETCAERARQLRF